MECGVEKVWPEWKTVRKLGEGSFGKVYEISRQQFDIEERCAVKVIAVPNTQAELESMRNEGMTEADITAFYKGLVDEFIKEIKLMSALKGHTNIVGYEDYAVIERKDSFGWDIYIRMELLTSLPSYIKSHQIKEKDLDATLSVRAAEENRKIFTERDVIMMSIDICRALELCYEKRIVHRDIKPDNVFVSPNGDYKLGDFGVARTIDKTVSGLSKKGTYIYMAPEIYKGELGSPNVDIYSLGIMMYKLLNNDREPFLPPAPQVIQYNDKANAIARRMSGEAISMPAHGSESLCAIVQKACAYDPQKRYRTPTEMKKDLETVLEGGVIATTAIGPISGGGSHDMSSEGPVIPPADFVKTAKSLKTMRYVILALGSVGLILSIGVLLLLRQMEFESYILAIGVGGWLLSLIMHLMFVLKKDSLFAVVTEFVASLCCASPFGLVAACMWGVYSKKKRIFDVRMRMYARSRSYKRRVKNEKNRAAQSMNRSGNIGVSTNNSQPIAADTKYCQRCGTAMTRQDMYCPQCGTKTP